MVRATSNRLEKADLMEDILKSYEKSNLPIRKFCKKEKIHTSKFYYWKKRLDQEGKKGLMDKREGKVHKLTKEIKKELFAVKNKYPLKSASDISKHIEKKFKKKISISHIQRTLRDLGVNDPVGRKPGKPLKKKQEFVT